MKKTILLYFLAPPLLTALTARALTVAETVPATEIRATASSTYNGSIVPANLINGTGMDEQGRHDNNQYAATMWHSTENPAPTSAAPGLPGAPAWVRFDFAKPVTLEKCLIWNHNQAGFTNRGFRHVQVFVATWGDRWEPIMVNGRNVFEIPQASGTGSLPASYELVLPRQPISAVALLANDNYGATFYGFSAVQFVGPSREVAIANLQPPAKLDAAAFPFVQEDDGEMLRQVEIKTGGVPVYEAVDAIVESGSARAAVHFGEAPAGRTDFLLNFPAGVGNKRNSSDKIKVTLGNSRWNRTLETQLVPFKQWPDLEEIIFTWKTHLDIGYTHHPLEVMDWYRTGLMDRAISLFEASAGLPANQRFIWMLPAWAMQLVLDDKQTPERRTKIEQAVRDHRLIFHALPYTFEAQAMDPEEMVRSLEYGVRAARHFNLPLPRDAKLTDMPMQAWITPTVLTQAGIKFLHIGCNDDSIPARVPTLFWWEGPDGSRLLTGYADRYSWPIIPPADWTHKTWLAMRVTLDNSGPPGPDAIKAALDEVHNQLPGVRVRFGRPSDFADAILKENSAIPVVRKDMPDTWIHGMMSMPKATGIHREASAMLPSLGLLDTELRAWKINPPDDISALLQRGYEQSCFFTEHTWGAAGPPGGRVFDPVEWKKRFDQGVYKSYEDEFDFHANYARQAMAAAASGVQPRIAELAKAVACNGPRVVVFNPLPWQRVAEVSLNLPDGAPAPAAVQDAGTHRLIPVQVEGRTLRFVAPNVPAGGYATFACVANTSAPFPNSQDANDTLETSRFKVKFDLRRGGIASLVDKASGRELVNGAGYALGQFLHQRFDSKDVDGFVNIYHHIGGSPFPAPYGKPGMADPARSPHWDATPGPWKISIAHNAVEDRATLTCLNNLGLAEGYTTTFTFPADRACVDIDWEVRNKTANPMPEGGWLCISAAIEKPAFRVGEVGATMDPAKDIVVGGNRELLAADRAITVREGDAGPGIGVASTNLPLWSLGEPGLWKYSDDYVPSKPDLFANLYNNQWSTNYPMWVGGSWRASMRIWPVAAGDTEEQAIFTPAWELRQPALAGYADGVAGNLPVAQPGVALSRKGTRVTAFCPNPYGAGTLLRVWEQAGTSGDLQVTLPAGAAFTRAQPVNLRGEQLGAPINIAMGRFDFPLGAWAPMSFVLE